MSHYCSEAQINRNLSILREMRDSVSDFRLKEIISTVIRYAENKNNPTEYRYKKCKKMVKELRTICCE